APNCLYLPRTGKYLSGRFTTRLKSLFLMTSRRIRVAWISDFPIEWIGDLPGELKHLPRKHAATWLRVLFDEFKADPQIDLHVVALRKNLTTNIAFEREG